jgi:hypothetical protein
MLRSAIPEWDGELAGAFSAGAHEEDAVSAEAVEAKLGGAAVDVTVEPRHALVAVWLRHRRCESRHDVLHQWQYSTMKQV